MAWGRLQELHQLNGLNGMGGQETVIELIELVDHFFDGKLIFNKLLAALAKPVAKRWVAGQREEVAGDRGDVAGSNQETGFAVETPFVCAIEVVGDNRFGCGQGLGQGARE